MLKIFKHQILFYHKCWDVISHDVISVVLNFLNTGVMSPWINHTLVTFIPKVKTPSSVKELRPISLCNVIYKLISKTLANRLKVVLPDIICESQSAFVPGR